MTSPFRFAGWCNDPKRQGTLVCLKSDWPLWAVLAIVATLHVAGISKQLPYGCELDEDYFVEPAVRIASTGDLNPRWFGHPGSTMIYPLAALVRLWHAVAYRGMLLHPDPNLAVSFQQDPSDFYIIGRLLSGTYWACALALSYKIGREIFNRRVASVSVYLAAACPLCLVYAQTVRTDGASAFFAVAGLCVILRSLKSPTYSRQMVAGLVIGLAIATKYYLAVLLPTLWWSSLVAWRRRGSRQIGALMGLSAVGTVASVAGFLAATPFFFADWQTTLADLTNEMRSSHPGLVTFSPAGNLLWYMGYAIPQTMTWANGLLAWLGVVLMLRVRNPLFSVILVFLSLFLLTISQSALHWQRWIIPIVPVLSLAAAYGGGRVYRYLQRQLPIGWRRALLPLCFGFVTLVIPTYRLAIQAIREARPTTALVARNWIVENIPAGSRIARELYTAPLSDTSFVVWNEYFLCDGGSLDIYCDAGYRYLMVSDDVYDRFLAHPELYPAEAYFYETLFREGLLIKEFKPTWLRGGSTIRVYELACSQR